MASNATAVKFGGLLVALGLFGMGPGSHLMDQVKSKYQHSKKKEEDDELPSQEHQQHHSSYLEPTSTGPFLEIQRRYTGLNYPIFFPDTSEQLQAVAKNQESISSASQMRVSSKESKSKKSGDDKSLGSESTPHKNPNTSWMSPFFPPRSSE